MVQHLYDLDSSTVISYGSWVHICVVFKTIYTGILRIEDTGYIKFIIFIH